MMDDSGLLSIKFLFRNLESGQIDGGLQAEFSANEKYRGPSLRSG
jgi:hypothetical protein